ncbi:hypothetical protein [Streptomyces antarcticus]|uniref:hypothetical protein n=1 Tax=Streptomyces antarcticus TaxID=2996458 RepID=UPI0022719EB7|nr:MULTISPECIES: hypothetical protein [unclassified Streptomyces]MCY0943845.1 hypothetical protein [Streptomyces sp. H34-AA3]MCZ4085697.1 hypothetical protein [Streptomyces sp. H34-S5]
MRPRDPAHLRPGGTLLAGHLILGPSAEVTRHLTDLALWRTHPLGETALCIKAGGVKAGE